MLDSLERSWWKDSERLNTTSGAQACNFSTTWVTLSKTASVSTSWPRRWRHSSTLASVGFCASFRDSAENSSPGSMRCATSKRIKIFISSPLDRPLKPASVQVIGDHRREVRRKLEVQAGRIARRGEVELAAAEHELADQHADGVLALAGPLHDGGDDRGAMAL